MLVQYLSENKKKRVTDNQRGWHPQIHTVCQGYIMYFWYSLEYCSAALLSTFSTVVFSTIRRWPPTMRHMLLKLSTRGSRLWCSTPVLPRRLSRYSGWQRSYLVAGLSPRVKGPWQFPDPILAALGQEKPFLESFWEERAVWRPARFYGGGIWPERHEFISRSGRFWRAPIIDFGSSWAGEADTSKFSQSLEEGRPRIQTNAILNGKNKNDSKK